MVLLDDERAFDALVRRTALLERLRERPADKRTLEADLDVSRSTINRGVRELEATGLTSYGSGRYELTLAGRLLLGRFRSFERAFTDLCRARDLLSVLPRDAPLAPSVVEGADVVTRADATAPAVGARLSGLLRRADSVRGFVRARIRDRTVDLLHERVVGEGMDATLVFRWAAVEHARTAFPDRFDDLSNCERFVPYAIDTRTAVPYSLYVFETGGSRRCCLVAHDNEGGLAGLLTNGSTASLDWAGRVLGDVFAEASPVQ